MGGVGQSLPVTLEALPNAGRADGRTNHVQSACDLSVRSQHEWPA